MILIVKYSIFLPNIIIKIDYIITTKVDINIHNQTHTTMTSPFDLAMSVQDATVIAQREHNKVQAAAKKENDKFTIECRSIAQKVYDNLAQTITDHRIKHCGKIRYISVYRASNTDKINIVKDVLHDLDPQLNMHIRWHSVDKYSIQLEDTGCLADSYNYALYENTQCDTNNKGCCTVS